MKFLKRFNEDTALEIAMCRDDYWKDSYELNDGSAKMRFDEMWKQYVVGECSVYLKEISGSVPLVRGTYSDESGFVDGELVWRKPRKNRIPRDIDKVVHEELDELFHKNFGESVRSEGVFTTKVIFDCTEYGSPFFVFPIGGFKYFWNPDIDDLYTKMEFDALYKFHISDDESYLVDVYGGGVDFDSMSDVETNNWYNKHRHLAQDAFYSDLEELVSGYQTDGLDHVKGQEVVIMCDEYYLIDIKFMKFVYKEL
jgi:hypothetical protein